VNELFVHESGLSAKLHLEEETQMILGIVHTPLLVRDYEEAKQFYCEKLGFIVVEDTQLEKKRWVRLQSPGGKGSEILLSKATDEKQESSVGNQTGGRVLFFLHTDDCDAEYERLRSQGIEFTEEPCSRHYGRVAVFKDLYGNRIDLVEPWEE
jgi:predicted enzyme related to lactoylglutathione lyase